MKMLQQIRQDIGQGENIDLYLTSIVAVVLAVLNLFGVTPEPWMASISLTALGVLAFAMLGNRHRVEDLIQKLSSPATPPLRMKDKLRPVEEVARDASDILIIAVSGFEVLRHTEFYAGRLNQGTTVRIALINPQNDAAVEAMCPVIGMSRDGFIAGTRLGMAKAQSIRRQTSNPEGFQVRVCDHASPLGFFMVDGHLPTGHIIVGMRPYQTSSSSRPHLFVAARDHPVWHMYFRDICESIWRDARPVSESYFAD